MEDTHEATVTVRGLKPSDLEAVIAIDSKNTGRRREAFFKIKLQQNLQETGIKISLAAETDAIFAGFLLARVYYGEFGTMEPVAVLDTIDVHPYFRGRGVGGALLGQLTVNLRGLNVATLRTEVGWDEPQLLTFFQHEGFRPAARFCLDLDVTRDRRA